MGRTHGTSRVLPEGLEGIALSTDRNLQRVVAPILSVHFRIVYVANTIQVISPPSVEPVPDRPLDRLISCPREEAWQANFDVDLLGAARVVEAATPLLEASETGSVIFISSTAALEFLGVPQPYNAIKAALIAHANDLSQALAPKGIRVNTVSPGPIYFEGGSWEMIKHAMPKMYEQALGSCALGRMGTPEEVARAVTFLASPAASLITGANLVADAGFTKRVAF